MSIKHNIMENMTLSCYYEDLGKAQVNFRKKIQEECGVSLATASRWVNGKITPRKSDREKIAGIVGRPVEELFPILEEA